MKVTYNFEIKVNQKVNLGRRSTPASPDIVILKDEFLKNPSKIGFFRAIYCFERGLPSVTQTVREWSLDAIQAEKVGSLGATQPRNPTPTKKKKKKKKKKKMRALLGHSFFFTVLTMNDKLRKHAYSNTT